MRLWTIQTTDVYNMIQKNGVYHCNEKLSFANDSDNVTNAYSWMAEQMREKIGSAPEGVKFPVWAWHTWEFKHKRPDLRCRSFHVWKPSVMMEIEVPDSRVLLSDEDKWYAVLNNGYLDNAIDLQTFEKDWDEFESLAPAEQEKIKIESWHRIFNIEPFKNEFACQGEWIQATFWELRKEDIVKAWPIKARKSRLQCI